MKKLNKTQQKTAGRVRRHARIRSTVKGTAAKPRLNIYRSNAFIYAQLIDDVAGKTVAQANDLKIKKGTKTERSVEVGKALAAAAKKAKVETIVFDRGGFKFTGRVAALADAAREAGLQF